jgi:hypothetical protein
MVERACLDWRMSPGPVGVAAKRFIGNRNPAKSLSGISHPAVHGTPARGATSWGPHLVRNKPASQATWFVGQTHVLGFLRLLRIKSSLLCGNEVHLMGGLRRGEATHVRARGLQARCLAGDCRMDGVHLLTCTVCNKFIFR